MPSAPALVVTDLFAGYERSFVLQGVSLTVTPGDAPLGVVGESGAGKTTLLRAMQGVVKPDRGSVTWNGRAVHRVGRDKKLFASSVRRVLQGDLTEPERARTVTKLVEEGLKDARKAGRTVNRSVEELLDVVALPRHVAQRQGYTLSGGERQRVILARAIAGRPDILLLDEPLTALDPAMRGDIATNIAEITQDLGTAVVLVSHDLELVARMTDEAIFLAGGKIVARGPVFATLASGEHPELRELAAAAPLAVQRIP